MLTYILNIIEFYNKSKDDRYFTVFISYFFQVGIKWKS